MKLVDVHAHMDVEEYSKDLAEVLARAEKAGVVAVISNGTDPKSNRDVLELAKKYPIIKPALGIYPVDALKREVSKLGQPIKEIDFSIDEEIEFIKKHLSEIAAIGEIGLDYSESEEQEKKQQKEIFMRFIELSEKTKKPLIVHSRKAEQDIMEMLESSNAKRAILHCFCGRKSLVSKAIDLDFHFSIPANIERSESFQANVKRIDISRLFTETDCPWLAPVKGERNEPANVMVVVKKIAELKAMDPEEVANNLFFNYQRMFL